MIVALNVYKSNMHSAPKFTGVKQTPTEVYETFYNKLINTVNNNYALDVNKSCDWFYKIAYRFDKEKAIDEFTKLSKGLIEFLVSNKLDNMAGMICSILIKFNRNNQNWKNVVDLSIRGVAIAKRANDVVHVAARAYDLNKILKVNEPGSDRHLKYLKMQNEALEDICRNYDTEFIQHCRTNPKELAPIENYEEALFNAKFDIAIFALLKEPKYAREQFEKAKKIYEKIKVKYPPETTAKIEKKIGELEKKYKICSR